MRYDCRGGEDRTCAIQRCNALVLARNVVPEIHRCARSSIFTSVIRMLRAGSFYQLLHPCMQDGRVQSWTLQRRPVGAAAVCSYGPLLELRARTPFRARRSIEHAASRFAPVPGQSRCAPRFGRGNAGRLPLAWPFRGQGGAASTQSLPACGGCHAGGPAEARADQAADPSRENALCATTRTHDATTNPLCGVRSVNQMSPITAAIATSESASCYCALATLNACPAACIFNGIVRGLGVRCPAPPRLLLPPALSPYCVAITWVRRGCARRCGCEPPTNSHHYAMHLEETECDLGCCPVRIGPLLGPTV